MMKLSLSYSNIQELLEELQLQTGTLCQVQNYETSFQLSQPFGRWSIRWFDPWDKFELHITEWELQEHLSLLTETQLYSSAGFSFCLSGRFRGTFHRSGSDLVAKSGDSHFGVMHGEDKAVTELAAGQKISLVQISMTPHQLRALTDWQLSSLPTPIERTLRGDESGFHWQTGSTTPAMAIALHQILNCPYQGMIRRFYLESKALELIALKYDQLTHEPTHLKKTLQLKSSDIDCAHQAREILLRHADAPPSVLALAKHVCVSDFKLKQLFHQVFGTTVFGCLHEYRMERARLLLETSRMSITQVSQTVGYANASKFSGAFKKKFGITPTSYRLNGKLL
ncbi:helix-turn-helix transcriptional regulator [Myxacorys almedinensis]|uniref:Helix-turn-helix domain-containing protein n=1 Tax=Myxacorys almedinensis A TaxID=2690445 RepID=A0A8J7Z0J5_9CYAN|nr:AraC family transcriptional regulator [Myxacorys almedinensis]NDJ17909.1 helix-turn-helix domain-containing protein [Myxacorys almedinensis A]